MNQALLEKQEAEAESRKQLALSSDHASRLEAVLKAEGDMLNSLQREKDEERRALEEKSELLLDVGRQLAAKSKHGEALAEELRIKDAILAEHAKMSTEALEDQQRLVAAHQKQLDERDAKIGTLTLENGQMRQGFDRAYTEVAYKLHAAEQALIEMALDGESAKGKLSKVTESQANLEKEVYKLREENVVMLEKLRASDTGEIEEWTRKAIELAEAKASQEKKLKDRIELLERECDAKARECRSLQEKAAFLPPAHQACSWRGRGSMRRNHAGERGSEHHSGPP